MEQWRDRGIVLAARAHGESGAVVTLLTENYGRTAGYVRGAQSTKMRNVIERGSLVSVNWSSRVSDGLGAFTLEQERPMGAYLMDEPLQLAAMMAACALCDTTLPEREPHPGLFHGLIALMETMQTEIWSAAYVMWELALLRELGYGIELTKCAGGGDPETLIWVSPKSGHAVSEAAGLPYKERLLPLPGFLAPQKGPVTDEEVLKGLRLTGYFLEHRAFAHHNKGIPDERLRFEERFAKTVEDSTSVVGETHGETR